MPPISFHERVQLVKELLNIKIEEKHLIELNAKEYEFILQLRQEKINKEIKK